MSNFLNAIISADGTGFKKTVAELQDDLKRLQASLKTASNPQDINALNKSISDTKNQIQKTLAPSNAFANSTFGVSRAMRTAHLDVDLAAQSIKGFAEGSTRGADALSNIIFTFERLKGTTGSSKAAFAALGEEFLGPAGIVVGATTLAAVIPALIEKFTGLSKAQEEAKKKAEEQKQVIEDVAKSAADELVKLTSVVGVIENANATREEQRKALKYVNDEYGSLLKNMGIEEVNVNNLKKAYSLLIDEILRQALIKGLQKEISDEVEKSAAQILRLQLQQEKENAALEKKNELTKKATDNQKPLIDSYKLNNQQLKDGAIAQADYNREQIKNIANQATIPEQIEKIKAKLLESIQPALKLANSLADLNINPNTDKELSDINNKLIKFAQDAGKFYNIPIALRFSDLDTETEKLKKAIAIKEGIVDFSIKLKIEKPVIGDLPVEIKDFSLKGVDRFQSRLQEGLSKGLLITPQANTENLNNVPGADLEKKLQDLTNQLVLFGRAGVRAFNGINFKNLDEGIEQAKNKLVELNLQTSVEKELALDVGNAFADTFKSILNGGNPLKTFFQSIAQSVENLIAKLIAAAATAELLNIITGGSFEGAKGFTQIFGKVLGFADGGHVVGQGTSKSDSIPAMLSNGEFVMKSDAVRKYGLNVMQGINALKFADGGLVGNRIIPAISTPVQPSLSRIAGGINVSISGEFVQRGQSLVAVINQVNKSNGRNF